MSGPIRALLLPEPMRPHLVQLVPVELLLSVVTPEVAPDPLVQLLREGLCQPVGQRLHHDDTVVVQLGLVPAMLILED